MGALITRNEPWHQYASRRKHNLTRVRDCDMCGARRETVEFHEAMPIPESTPDRCPECIVGPGRVKVVRYPSNRFRRGMMLQGAVVRIRQCTVCCHEWLTNEMPRGGKRLQDTTRCECGGRMRINRRS